MVDSEFDSCLKDTRLNSAEASHCVTTVGKLITPTVPRGVELRRPAFARNFAKC